MIVRKYTEKYCWSFKTKVKNHFIEDKGSKNDLHLLHVAHSKPHLMCAPVIMIKLAITSKEMRYMYIKWVWVRHTYLTAITDPVLFHDISVHWNCIQILIQLNILHIYIYMYIYISML